MRLDLKGYIPVFIVLLFLISSVSAQTELIVPDDNKTRNNSIDANDLSSQISNIRVVFDHIFISNKNNSLEISEIVIFRNEGEAINYNRDNPAFFAISTPPDIKDLKTQVMECCLVQEEGVVYMDPMRSIKSGENFEMKISYTLRTQDHEYVFNKSAIYNTTSLSILVEKNGGMVTDELYDAITLSGIEYNAVNFNDLNQGENVSIPIRIKKEPDYLYAGIGLFILFSIGLVYHFRGTIKSRGKKELTLEELELEKKKIFHTVYGFRKHAGSEGSEEYRKLIEEYRNKAIQIYYKIENLKNKK